MSFDVTVGVADTGGFSVSDVPQVDGNGEDFDSVLRGQLADPAQGAGLVAYGSGETYPDGTVGKTLQGLDQTLRTDLADSADADKGAGLVAYNAALSYAAGTLGAAVNTQGGEITTINTNLAELVTDLADYVDANKGAGEIGFGSGLDYSGAPNSVGAALQSLDTFKTNLPLVDSPSHGAGMVGFLYSLAYAGNTVGAWLKNLATSAGAGFIGYLSPLTSAVLRSVQSKLSDCVSVMDFMTSAQIADVLAGTLSQDVTAAVQAAVNATPIGGRLFFPAGRYKLTAAVTCAQPINLQGCGNGSAYNDSGTYIVQTSTTANCFTWVAAQANYAFGQYGIVGINLRDLCIQGNSSATPSNFGIGVDTTINSGVFHIRENSIKDCTFKYFKVGVQWTGIAYLNKLINVQFVRCIRGLETKQGASGTTGGQTRLIGCTFSLLPTLTAAGQGCCVSWFEDAEGGDLTVLGSTFADGYRGIVANDYANLYVAGSHFENLKAANSFAGTTAGSGAGIYLPTLSSKANPVSGACKTILGNNFNANDQSVWVNNQSSGLGAGTTMSFYPAYIEGNTSVDAVFLNLTAPAGVYGFTGPEFRLGRSNAGLAGNGALAASQITGLFQSVSDDRKFRFTRRYAFTGAYVSGSALDVLPAGLIVTSARVYLTANASGATALQIGDQGSATRYANLNGQTQALNTWVNYTPTVPPFAVTANTTDKLALIATGGMLGAAGVIEIDGYVP